MYSILGLSKIKLRYLHLDGTPLKYIYTCIYNKGFCVLSTNDTLSQLTELVTYLTVLFWKEVQSVVKLSNFISDNYLVILKMFISDNYLVILKMFISNILHHNLFSLLFKVSKMPDSLKSGFQSATSTWHWIKIQEVCKETVNFDMVIST
jgi:hypothetical protein